MTAEISAPGCQKWIPAGLVPLARTLWRNYKGFRLFLLYLVGRVPWHAFRLSVYRHLFHISIGLQSAIHWRTRFYAPGGICIGHNTIIGYDAFLDGRYGLTIGNNVNIGGEVSIFTAQHDPNDPGFGMVGGPVVIEDYVYVGSRVTILPNVTIGRGAVVATGAVVIKDVAPFDIVGGVPARKVGERQRHLAYTLNFHMPFQ
jgi:acetyltransferase-like isoleucine patch superfamily enzyme